jgi:hypothetical protein
MLWLKDFFVKPQAAITTIVATCLLIFSAREAALATWKTQKKWHRLEMNLDNTISYSRSSMSSDDVVLVAPSLDTFESIPRLLGQPTLVGWKFLPQNPAGIIQWWELMRFRIEIFRKGCMAPLRHRVDFILVTRPEWSRSEALKSCGNVVVADANYVLLKLDDRKSLSWPSPSSASMTPTTHGQVPQAARSVCTIRDCPAAPNLEVGG